MHHIHLERKQLEGRREAIHTYFVGMARLTHREMRTRVGDEIVSPEVAAAWEDILRRGTLAIGGKFTVQVHPRDEAAAG